MPQDGEARVTNARLQEAAERGEAIEVVLVLRGHVRRLQGPDGRWRIRSRDDHVVTFRADTVVAMSRPAKPSGDVPQNGAGPVGDPPAD